MILIQRFKNTLILKPKKLAQLKMGVIEIEGMEFYTYHGHFPTEQIVGNRFIVNLSLKTDCLAAAQTDDLDDALNYQSVYLVVKEEMNIKSKLLENLAWRIINRLYKEFDNIDKVKIKISKLNPPMGGEIEKVSVTMER